MSVPLQNLLFGLALACPSLSASANVIADWDAKAVSVIARATPAPQSQREAALVSIAMFDAVNAIDGRYRQFLVELMAAPTTTSSRLGHRFEIKVTGWRCHRRSSSKTRG